MSTKIQWTEMVWNCVTGCTKVSTGCKYCYAEAVANRFWKDRKFTDIQCHEDKLAIPLKRKKPTTYFVNSMSDLFHEAVPFEFIDKVFAVMNATQFTLPANPKTSKYWHTYQILTKRPERMLEYLKSRQMEHWPGGSHPLFKVRGEVFRGHGHELMNAGAVLTWPLHNLWLGVSCENQEQADKRIPILLKCPAAVRWVSAEPLLGPIDFREVCCLDGDYLGPNLMNLGIGAGINWVVCGGESGPNARPCNIQWIRDIRDQCKAAAVPCFIKQCGSNPYDFIEGELPPYPVEVTLFRPALGHMTPHFKDRKGGDPSEWPADLRIREMPASNAKVGKGQPQ